MSRTPLMHVILRAYRTIRAADRTGLPLDEVVARERETLSRRKALQLSAGALVTACTTARTSTRPDRSASVAIVGGGIAGLHCAYRLQRAGIRASVYDAGKRLGGRMFTDRATFPDGMHCELGGELIDSGHATMHALAQELGLELLDYSDDTAVDAYYFGGQRYGEQEVLDAFRPVAKAIDDALAARRDPAKGVTRADANGLAALDRVSLAEWLQNKDFPPLARDLLTVAYRGECGLEPDECNVLNLLLAISTNTQRLALYGASDERFHTKSGNDSFIQKLAAALPPEQLHLEHRLTELRQASDGRYRLTFERGSSTVEAVVDHVVLALPFSILRGVTLRVELPETKRIAIQSLGYGAHTKLMVGFHSRPWREAGFNGVSYSDLAFQQTWETSRMQNPRSKAGILTNFTGGRFGRALGEGTPEERGGLFLQEIERVWPGAQAAANGRVARMHWPSYPHTKASYSAYLVGQYTAFAGDELARVGNLHFCGEHTSLDAQGYMEGGAFTGAMAADEVARDLGVSLARREGLQGKRILTRVRLAREGGGSWLTGLLRRAA